MHHFERMRLYKAYQTITRGIGALGHVPRLAIVITGLTGAGKTHTARRVKDLLQTLFGTGNVQQYNAVRMVNAAAQTITRAMTVFGRRHRAW
eukprot:COSAG03_NODE_155_length_11433_cov_30.588759_12_plen_92_part_00